jgi:hypothetical protein
MARSLETTLLLLLLAASASAGCDHPGPGDSMTENASTPVDGPAIELVEETGIVTRLHGSDQYAINFSVEGTIDTVYTGLIDDIDDALRQPGLKVRVTGRLVKTPGLPQAQLGGQEMFRLDASEIVAAE